ncbi:MAG: hypothetical protein ACR2N3_05970 [Pyrinomonadaceae bacterium]
MLKTRCKFLLTIGLIIAGLTANAFAASKDDKNKIPKNTGILSVKTTPNPQVVRVDGVQVGMSGVGTANEFYLTPGMHRVEVEGPNGKIWTKDIEIRKGVRNCVCLKTIEERTERPCPYNVRVDGPERVVEGDLITFVATNLIPAAVPLTYRWKVSPNSAQITSGLGTPSITVDTKGIGNQPITAELDVTDDVYGATCQQRNSVTTGVEVVKPPQPFRFDMFESKSFDDDKARLDNYVIQVQSVPDSQAYIIMYQGTDKESVKRGDVDKLSKRALDYLVRAKGLDPSRIVITKWGTKAHTTYELWIIPPGAQPPVPQ